MKKKREYLTNFFKENPGKVTEELQREAEQKTGFKWEQISNMRFRKDELQTKFLTELFEKYPKGVPEIWRREAERETKLTW
jgi:hypothetical protein